MNAAKQYADRDVIQLDRDGGYYCRHVYAMTTEGLHSKSEIAAELAWRDREIDRLRANAAEVVAELRAESSRNWDESDRNAGTDCSRYASAAIAFDQATSLVAERFGAKS